jgi:uncharacterized protein
MQIPIFPLPLVLFSGEYLNLHIFEPRYKQMISYCLEHKQGFGVVPVIDGKLMELGTIATISRVAKTYEDGSMDIVVSGGQQFQVQSTNIKMGEFLFGSATIDLRSAVTLELNDPARELLYDSIKKLYQISGVQKSVPDDWNDFQMEHFIHYLGLSLDQEYEVFKEETPEDRYMAVVKYIQQIIPALQSAKSMKDRISMNGHFQELKSPPWV